ncbi:MAG: hypothetical protein ACREQI_14825 [Candidatus Binataceae bacterium]
MRRTVTRALLITALIGAPMLAGCQSESKQHLYAANALAEKYKAEMKQGDTDAATKDLQGAKQELELSIKAGPDNLDAHKSLANVAEVLGDQQLAAKEFDKASELDPTDQDLMKKARFYHQIQERATGADSALADIKAGRIQEGISSLKDLAKYADSQAKALKTLDDALPAIEKQGDDQLAAKKYAAAIATYDQGVRAAMFLSFVRKMKQLDPRADAMLHKANQAAQAAGTPDATFHLLNDVLGNFSGNKTANLELAQLYLNHTPPDYDTAADLEERGGAPDDQVAKLRAEATAQRKKEPAKGG